RILPERRVEFLVADEGDIHYCCTSVTIARHCSTITCGSSPSTRHTLIDPPTRSSATIVVPRGSVGTAAFGNASTRLGSRRWKSVPYARGSSNGKVIQTPRVTMAALSGAGRVTVAATPCALDVRSSASARRGPRSMGQALRRDRQRLHDSHADRGARVGGGRDRDANLLLRGRRLVDDLVHRIPKQPVADGDREGGCFRDRDDTAALELGRDAVRGRSDSDAEERSAEQEPDTGRDIRGRRQGQSVSLLDKRLHVNALLC